jgi:3-hydroxymyristoyl/3-hydroxydecanoyl-(acyl carrier protein) dehydratase
VAESRLGEFRLEAEHGIFAGHFPGEPLVPGVMLLDWVLREASLVLQLEPRQLKIRESKFFAPLTPGAQAELFFEAAGGRYLFRIRRGEQLLVSGVLEPA